ncbi:cystathionine beta-lyase [Pandoraea cepalis]|uniref:Cystathionine beta-lyase n=1 Tax=Pandoraea cepalis TaxID=2508294 RepID=A0A5E4RFI6_9BURK|nr:cystathionine beta-lyase [Pandoraea cepalis]VVD61272.1 cystathionine beta-lyase [Pandoraea cepalis]
MKRADTVLTHAGRSPADHAGMVNPPVYRTSTVIFPTLEAYEKRRELGDHGVRYGRHGTPTTFAFERAVAELEGGYRSVALPNGLAAIAATLLALAAPGSHVLVPDTVYAPARKFCMRRLVPLGIDVQFYDPKIGAGIAALIREETAVVYCESPGSMTFEVQDIPAIAKAARAAGCAVVADNTWATPYFYSPFEHGVDVSIHAATKYIGGHSDLMMGVITTNERYWRVVRDAVSDFGYGVSPDDCYLALRGLRTMGVRLKQQMESALAVARWLQARPEVSRVLYPALPEDPGHALWQRDFRGAASLFAIVLREDCTNVRAFVDALRLFAIGSSWGGFESLVNVVHAEAVRTVNAWRPEGAVVRLHVGLEDVSDLIGDLEQALPALRTAC